MGKALFSSEIVVSNTVKAHDYSSTFKMELDQCMKDIAVGGKWTAVQAVLPFLFSLPPAEFHN